MPIGTPAYYYANAADKSWASGFEDASIKRGRDDADAQSRLLDKQQDFGGQQNMYDRLFKQQQGDADRNANASNLRAQLDNQGAQSAADRAFQGAEGDKNRANQMALGMAPTQFAREKFSAISPYITSLLGGLTGGGVGQFAGQAPGGQQTQTPTIDASPVYSGQQVNQQVNAAKAGNEAKAASTDAGNASRMAAQGFGSRSPLLAALANQTALGTMAANADADRQIRYDASTANSSHVLDAQKAQQQQWADVNENDLRRRQVGYNGTASLLGALAGLL